MVVLGELAKQRNIHRLATETRGAVGRMAKELRPDVHLILGDTFHTNPVPSEIHPGTRLRAIGAPKGKRPYGDLLVVDLAMEQQPWYRRVDYNTHPDNDVFRAIITERGATIFDNRAFSLQLTPYLRRYPTDQALSIIGGEADTAISTATLVHLGVEAFLRDDAATSTTDIETTFGLPELRAKWHEAIPQRVALWYGVPEVAYPGTR
jgi:hypothetical protein